MATVYVTLRIMPESDDVDLDGVEERITQAIADYDANLAETEREPVAFGLKAINATFSMDEDRGDTEDLEEEMETFDGVQSVQVTDVRRAIG